MRRREVRERYGTQEQHGRQHHKDRGARCGMPAPGSCTIDGGIMGRIRRRLGRLTEPLSDRSVRRLWYARTVSEAGNWAARIALTLYVFAETRSPLAAAAVTTVSLLPHLGVGQVLGTLADRFPHRSVMVVSDVVRRAAVPAARGHRPAGSGPPGRGVRGRTGRPSVLRRLLRRPAATGGRPVPRRPDAVHRHPPGDDPARLRGGRPARGDGRDVGGPRPQRPLLLRRAPCSSPGSATTTGTPPTGGRCSGPPSGRSPPTG